MGRIDTSVLQQNLMSLERAFEAYQKAAAEEPNNFEFYRNSLIKTFEYTLETCGKLLRKRLEPFFAGRMAVDALTFKDVFREAHHRGLLDEETAERWETYRDHRNRTAHEYGLELAEQAVSNMDTFIQDAQHLKEIIEHE